MDFKVYFHHFLLFECSSSFFSFQFFFWASFWEFKWQRFDFYARNLNPLPNLNWGIFLSLFPVNHLSIIGKIFVLVFFYFWLLDNWCLMRECAINLDWYLLFLFLIILCVVFRLVDREFQIGWGLFSDFILHLLCFWLGYWGRLNRWKILEG